MDGHCETVVVNTTVHSVNTAEEVSPSPVVPPTAQETTPAASENTAKEPATPLGVGQAAGIFSTLAASWKSVTGAAVLVALLAGLVWKRQVLSAGLQKIRSYRGEKARREEEDVRRKLRQQGLIK